MSKLPTFLIEVSHSSELNEQCLLAMVSAYTNGVISNNRITTATAWYEVDSLPSCGWTVMGWTDRVQSELADMLFAELYCLLAGFCKSGIRVRYQGPQQAQFPDLTSDDLDDSAGCVKIFQDHVTNSQRTKPYSWSTLARCSDELLRLKNIDEVETTTDWECVIPTSTAANCDLRLFRYLGRLLVQISCSEGGEIKGYQLKGFAPNVQPDCKRWIDRTAREVRTWGEAWVKHDDSNRTLLSNLLFLPNEIAILTDRMYRYRVQQTTTLERLRTMSFGLGKSSAFCFDEWLAFTDRYLSHRQFDLARKCLHQAKRLATDTQAEQLKFRMQRLTKSSEPSKGIGTSKPKRKLFSSLKKLFNEKTYQALLELETARDRAYYASDYGRYPLELPGAIHRQFSAEELLSANLTPALLTKMLGEKIEPPLPTETRGLFQACIANEVVWGCTSRACYYFESIPNTLFYPC